MTNQRRSEGFSPPGYILIFKRTIDSYLCIYDKNLHNEFCKISRFTQLDSVMSNQKDFENKTQQQLQVMIFISNHTVRTKWALPWTRTHICVSKLRTIGSDNGLSPDRRQSIIWTRAGVLVLGTRTRSTRVLNFWYSYCTRTRELQSNSTRTCTRTRGQVLRYSYEYWHEYWYSMVHLMICDVRVKKHHTCQINSLTYHEGKFPNWFILLLWLNIWYMGCDCKFHNVF